MSLVPMGTGGRRGLLLDQLQAYTHTHAGQRAGTPTACAHADCALPGTADAVATDAASMAGMGAIAPLAATAASGAGSDSGSDSGALVQYHPHSLLTEIASPPLLAEYSLPTPSDAAAAMIAATAPAVEQQPATQALALGDDASAAAAVSGAAGSLGPIHGTHDQLPAAAPTPADEAVGDPYDPDLDILSPMPTMSVGGLPPMPHAAASGGGGGGWQGRTLKGRIGVIADEYSEEEESALMGGAGGGGGGGAGGVYDDLDFPTAAALADLAPPAVAVDVGDHGASSPAAASSGARAAGQPVPVHVPVSGAGAGASGSDASHGPSPGMRLIVGDHHHHDPSKADTHQAASHIGTAAGPPVRPGSAPKPSPSPTPTSVTYPGRVPVKPASASHAQIRLQPLPKPASAAAGGRRPTIATKLGLVNGRLPGTSVPATVADQRGGGSGRGSGVGPDARTGPAGRTASGPADMGPGAGPRTHTYQLHKRFGQGHFGEVWRAVRTVDQVYAPPPGCRPPPANRGNAGGSKTGAAGAGASAGAGAASASASAAGSSDKPLVLKRLLGTRGAHTLLSGLREAHFGSLLARLQAQVVGDRDSVEGYEHLVSQVTLCDTDIPIY